MVGLYLLVQEKIMLSKIVETIHRNQNILLTGLDPSNMSLEEYIQSYLPSQMQKEKGCRRLRKKKAKKNLRQQWSIIIMLRPISRRLNYSEIGRKLIDIQPLPPVNGLHYFKE
jgi:hypothetical protein